MQVGRKPQSARAHRKVGTTKEVEAKDGKMAKSYNNLWQRMIDPDNIEAAIYSAARGKGRKREVQRALANVPATVSRIKGMLERDEWRPPEVREGRLYADGIARKERLLVKPDFDEQIVHHLLIDEIIQPIFQPGFFEWSCGSIPGRGQEAMCAHIMRKIKRGGSSVKYGVVLDIRKCFQTIDTAAIERAVGRKIRDKRVMRLVRMVLDANKIQLPDGTIQEGGVPIGLFTSPWFVNIALTETDHAVKDVVYLYVRYIDDMLLMHGSRRALRKVVGMIESKVKAMGMGFKRPGTIFIFGKKGIRKIRFTGCHFTRERMCVRDRVFIRARRTGAMIRRKIRNKVRVAAYDAERLISYGGRFRSFGSYAAFPKDVLRGINFALMRRKVSMRDRKRSKERNVV